jgi:SAM-dependent methyltransferase
MPTLSPMPIGRRVRALLGPLEPAAIRVYRRSFIDLDALAARLAATAGERRRILEVGCGDGALLSALSRAFPTATLLGIDPYAPQPGRMFTGDRSRVAFSTSRLEELSAEDRFDLVVLCDVVHHVAEDQRAGVIAHAASVLAPQGLLVIKEWELRPGLGNLIAFTADRWISGDRSVRFMPRSEIAALIRTAVPAARLLHVSRIPPRKANLLLVLATASTAAAARPAVSAVTA